MALMLPDPADPLCGSTATIHTLWGWEAFHIRTEDKQTFHCSIKYQEKGLIAFFMTFCEAAIDFHHTPVCLCFPEAKQMVALGICRGKGMIKISATVIQTLQAARNVHKAPRKRYYLPINSCQPGMAAVIFCHLLQKDFRLWIFTTNCWCSYM